ncbi:MAG: hypothetical protein HY718_04770, partial [Planctomycetes bacterium]|nr:hypothetical protein [Planctomycetota bacterium]
RWFWWRLNAEGELAATIATWVLAPALLFGRVFDAPVRHLFHTEAAFSSDPNLLGARMLFMVVTVTGIAVAVSLMTRPTDPKRLEEFVLRARPFGPLWSPVTRRLGQQYRPLERFEGVLGQWVLATVSMLALLIGLGKLLLGEPLAGTLLIAVFLISLLAIVRRVNADLG